MRWPHATASPPATGPVPDQAVEAAKAAGVSDAQIVEVALAIASITFTNLFNRINNTAMDFPPAD